MSEHMQPGPEGPFPHGSEKTEEDIARQIDRIRGRIGSKVAEHALLIESTNTPESTIEQWEHIHDDGSTREEGVSLKKVDESSTETTVKASRWQDKDSTKATSSVNKEIIPRDAFQERTAKSVGVRVDTGWDDYSGLKGELATNIQDTDVYSRDDRRIKLNRGQSIRAAAKNLHKLNTAVNDRIEKHKNEPIDDLENILNA